MQKRKMKIRRKREGTCLYRITSQKTVFLNLYLLVKESGKQISFTNTKEKRDERLQDVHENNILNVNVSVVNILEITHIADS
jgi:transcriptional regulator NrdR family protein